MKNEFTQVDFGPILEYLNNDDVTDISYSNGGQVWLKTLSMAAPASISRRRTLSKYTL